MKKHRFTWLITAALASVGLFTFSATAAKPALHVQAVSAKSLSSLNYRGKDIVTVNGNKPSFSKGN